MSAMCKCRISATFGRIKRHGEPRLELKSDKMKTVIKYLILLPFISACVQSLVNEPDSDTTDSPIVLLQTQIASYEDRFQSKTILGEKYDGKYYPNYWAAGDVISVNETDHGSELFKDIKGSKVVTPKWLEVDTNVLSGTVIAIPQRDDIDLNIAEHLIIELYSR